MSREAVFELLKKAESDDDLRRRLAEDLERTDEPLGAFLSTAASAGCEFSGDEFIEAIEQARGDPQSGELSDTQLDAVVAGASLGSTAYSQFRNYRSGPSIRKINPGGPIMDEEEELIM